MCGGAGTRLWPVSRPERPKQFQALVGERTLFADTLERVRGVGNARAPVIVAGRAQAAALSMALREANATDATLLLEPEGRDSAPAIAAAAHLVRERDPDGVMVVLASDHHVPDAAAFRRAVETAVEAARGGRIVCLGIEPREPSEAYGYIRPVDPQASVGDVLEFREKPDRKTAARYIADGYLWNSGNFIAPAALLLSELEAHAPAIAEGAGAALRAATAAEGGLVLADGFRAVPKVSIDYAVMERTQRAAVVRAALSWSDLGAWDAIHAALPHDGNGNAVRGRAVLSEAQDSLVFNRTDRTVALHGTRGIGVVVEEDAVLVLPLTKAQGVKAVVDALPPRTTGASSPDLAEEAERLRRWLFDVALPFWWTLGFDHERGVWREEIGADGRPTQTPARARVQGRQLWAFAAARAAGWAGPDVREAGLRALERYGTPLIRTLVAADGTVLDDTRLLYDQTFTLLALAAIGDEPRALALLDAIEGEFARAGDGLRENGDRPFQSNAHMHLLEAALHWTERGESPRWRALADRIVRLAERSFVRNGAVRELFDADWSVVPAPLEPGHQFEWAHLLQRHHAIRGGTGLAPLAASLFETGRAGVGAHGLATSTDAGPEARLWPQTEWLKAALVLGDAAPDPAPFRVEAERALAAMNRYLDAGPLWRDRAGADGRPVDGPAPASSLYHLAGAILELARRTRR